MVRKPKIRRVIGIGLLCLMLAAGCGVRIEETDRNVENFQFSVSQQETEIIENVQRISQGNYAYECLSEEGKLLYDQMLEAILGYQPRIELAVKDVELMMQAYQAINCDYGSLFWVDGYSYFTSITEENELVSLEFAPNYTMTVEEKEAYQNQIDAVVDEWLSGIGMQDSDYDKAKYVFETLIENVDYQEGALYNQNILSAFLYRRTVCQGYACATQYLLRQLGIPCTVVAGSTHDQPHAWNIVQLDGNYYYMDTTWGNSAYLNTESQESQFVNYNFLCMTDEELKINHQLNMPFELPECNSIENNYYVREGRYFETFDPEAMGQIFQEAWENKSQYIDVKCSNAEIYEQVKEYFIVQQKIADYCNGMEYIYYMEEPQFRVFTLNFY